MVSPSRCPPWQPERPGPTRREPRRAQRSYTTPRDTIRWIVPLNSRVDYLNLHTGKSIQIPFDELVIFSTNLHPNELMDPAFQGRIAYKLETLEPEEDLFRKVFEGMASKQGLELTDEVYSQVMAEIQANEAPLAYFQPKFMGLISQCRQAKQSQAKPNYDKLNPAHKTLTATHFVNTDRISFNVSWVAVIFALILSSMFKIALVRLSNFTDIPFTTDFKSLISLGLA